MHPCLPVVSSSVPSLHQLLSTYDYIRRGRTLLPESGQVSQPLSSVHIRHRIGVLPKISPHVTLSTVPTSVNRDIFSVRVSSSKIILGRQRPLIIVALWLWCFNFALGNRTVPMFLLLFFIVDISRSYFDRRSLNISEIHRKIPNIIRSLDNFCW